MNLGAKNRNQLVVENFMARMHAHPTGQQMQALPLTPTVPDLPKRKLRARLMLEECLETIREGLGLDIRCTGANMMVGTTKDVEFVEARPVSLIEVADGLADCEVVNLGCAAACGIAHQPMFDAVMQNNMLKFAPGHSFDAGGKLVKPSNHPDVYKQLRSLLLDQGASNVDVPAE